MNKEIFFNKLLPSYEAYYNVEKDFQLDGYTYFTKADFHSRSEKYMLTKSAKIWAHENHEYVYFVLEEQLNLQQFKEISSKTLNHGISLVEPHKEHMYTYITLIYLANSIDNEITREIKKSKYHKNYAFSFHGWCDFRVVGVDFNANKVYTNGMGREFVKTYSKLLKES